MSKYGKEDVYVIASDGSRVLREVLSQYERTLSQQKFLQSPEKFENKLQKEENMSNIEENETEISHVNDDATVINYIMLARIYDLLTVIGDSLGRGEDMLKMINLHRQGQLMSPPPVIATNDSEVDTDEK
jgi:hypothetical protein